MKTLLFNAWFYAAFAVYAVLNAPVFFSLTLADRLFLPRRAQVRRLRLRIHRFGQQVIWLMRPGVTVKREGEGWQPPGRACVYVCNHRSFSDPWLISQLPRSEIAQIVNRWPFKLPVLGVVARLAEYVNIKQLGLEKFLEKGAELLLRGNVSLVSLPEGTRVPHGAPGVFHGEIFRLAKQTGAPIVPLVFCGNSNTPPRGSMLLRPATIRMRLLPPLTFDEYREWSPFKLKETVRDRIREAVLEMEGERPREPHGRARSPSAPQPTSAPEALNKNNRRWSEAEPADSAPQTHSPGGAELKEATNA